MTDSRLIAAGIAAAVREDRELDDATAKIVAAQFHDGSGAALRFLSTGTIGEDPSALWRHFGDGYVGHDREERLALDWFGTYLHNRPERGPIHGWEDVSW